VVGALAIAAGEPVGVLHPQLGLAVLARRLDREPLRVSRPGPRLPLYAQNPSSVSGSP
jgi:hypothetical protein